MPKDRRLSVLLVSRGKNKRSWTNEKLLLKIIKFEPALSGCSRARTHEMAKVMSTTNAQLVKSDHTSPGENWNARITSSKQARSIIKTINFA